MHIGCQATNVEGNRIFKIQKKKGFKVTNENQTKHREKKENISAYKFSGETGPNLVLTC